MSPDQILNKTFPMLFDLPVPSADFSRPGGKDAIDYATDYWQRSILFLDILRQRGNQQAEMTSRPINAVLIYDYEIIMRGQSLPRPVNYGLVPALPPKGSKFDPTKRPVVVIDPRAGQGPGIGGVRRHRP